MISFLKTFLIILGSFLIGFGIAFILINNLQIKYSYNLLIEILSLIFGGFFLGFGLVSSTSKEKSVSEEKTKEEVVNNQLFQETQDQDQNKE